jgi:serine protease
MTGPASGHRRSRPRRKQTARQLGLEVLEDRNLLSTSPASSAIDLSGLAVNTGQYSSSDILVLFNPAALIGGKVPTLAGTSAEPLPLITGLYEVKLPSGMSVARALAEYQADPAVTVAEPDYSLSSSTVPDNPMFDQQSDLLNTGQGGGTPGDDIDVTNAWSVTTGSASTVVAVMDTGIDYDQQDLYENIWINQAEIPKSRLAPSLGGTNPNGIQDYYHDGYVSWQDLNDPRNIGPGKVMDLDGAPFIDASDILAPMVLNAKGQDTGYGGWAYPGNTQDGDTAHPNDFIGWNFVDNNNNPLDENGHGTHVSGIIGAMGNSGVGVAGINWQVSLMDVQFLNANGTGSISAFISALNYAVEHGAKISNNSWSGAADDPLLLAAITNAQAHGMIFVAAAGNDATDTDVTPAYPSSFNLNNVVSVAAVDDTNQLASFSNYGAKTVDLAAPGVNILSTLPNNTYGTMSGTSMAAPMVTGVIALVWTEHPTWTYLQVIDQVLDTVDPIPGLQGKVLTGGVLDAARAVGYVPPPVSTPTKLQVLSSKASGNAANTLNSIVLTFNMPVNPSHLTNTNVALLGPNGQRIAIQSFQTVANSGGTQIDLLFPTQSAAGTYYLYVGAGLESASSAALAATYENSFQLQLSSVSKFTSTTAVGIPDVSQTTTTLTVPESLIIGQIAVTINMVNSIDGKIVLTLQSPDGTSIPLTNLAGGNGSGFTGTVFNDQATTSINAGKAPFTGSYQPETPLASLVGENAQGTWKLNIVDHGTNYHVTLTSWSLTITGTDGSTLRADASSVPAALATSSAVSVSSVANAASNPSTLGAPFEHMAFDGLAAASLAFQDLSSTTGNVPARQQASSSAPANATRAADDLFAAVDGIDRLAELRVMMPHSNRSAGASDYVAFDDSSDEVDDADVVASAWMDR